MIYFVCAMGYGDCLVTLSVMERLGVGDDVCRVIGTGVARRVSQLLSKAPAVIEVLPDTAGFYVIKERGLTAAVKDFVAMRRSLALITQPADLLIFERGGLRNEFLIPRARRGIYTERRQSAYVDRRAIVQSLLGAIPDWQPVSRPLRKVRRLLLNPCARIAYRNFSPAVVAAILSIAYRSGWETTLLDPCGCYGDHAGRVAMYRLRPDLHESAALLRQTDFYVGPDSFFMHLAYYYGVPLFCLFHPDNLYFQPPGMSDLGNFMFFDDAKDSRRFERAISEFAGL